MRESTARVTAGHPAAHFSKSHPSTRVAILYEEISGRRLAVHVLQGTPPLQSAYVDMLRASACGLVTIIKEGRARITLRVDVCDCGGIRPLCGAEAQLHSETCASFEGGARLAEIVFERGRGWARLLHPGPMCEGAPGITIVASDALHKQHDLDFLARRLNLAEAETLRLAVRLGYYEKPRGCTMDELAAALGITKSAVCHRLNKLEQKAILSMLAAAPPA